MYELVASRINRHELLAKLDALERENAALRDALRNCALVRDDPQTIARIVQGSLDRKEAQP